VEYNLGGTTRTIEVVDTELAFFDSL